LTFFQKEMKINVAMSRILALFSFFLVVNAGPSRYAALSWHRLMNLAPRTELDPTEMVKPEHGSGEWSGIGGDSAPTPSQGGEARAETVAKGGERSVEQNQEKEKADRWKAHVSRRGYLPMSTEESQGAILCVLIGSLVLPTLLLASSCWKAHHQTQMPTPPFLHVLGEKRTMRLIIIPLVAGITTMSMTWLNYKWYQHALGVPMNETYYVSQVLNFRRVEPWSAWLARWSIWVLVLCGTLEFKGEVLPWEVMWLPLLCGMALLSAMAIGIHQYDVEHSYESPVWGVGGEERVFLHAVCAVFAYCLCWLESVMFWWPNKLLHVGYGILMVVWIRMPWENVKIFIEWAVLAGHLLIVWHKAPRVQLEVQQGTWKPWLGSCHCCCPFIEVLPGGTNWCPPNSVPKDAAIIGEPVAVRTYMRS